MSMQMALNQIQLDGDCSAQYPSELCPYWMIPRLTISTQCQHSVTTQEIAYLLRSVEVGVVNESAA